VHGAGALQHPGKPFPAACWELTIHRRPDDRLHAREKRTARRRVEGGQNQAVDRSRGGRNRKIHALADVKGRLIALLLTESEAHDYPITGRPIRRVKPTKRMLGNKAYDSGELREGLDERGTKPVIPNRCNRKKQFSFSKRVYKLRWRNAMKPSRTELNLANLWSAKNLFSGQLSWAPRPTKTSAKREGGSCSRRRRGHTALMASPLA